MGGNTELTGPDLASGITIETLESGSKILGHAFGAPVGAPNA